LERNKYAGDQPLLWDHHLDVFRRTQPAALSRQVWRGTGGTVHQRTQSVDGQLSRRALALVLEWANEHRDELMNNWISLETTGEYTKIPPLE